MGSKRWMLQNGLGTMLRAKCANANRFVDLFAGSGAVACFVAKQMDLPVLASDLQAFSAILTKSVISRDRPFDPDRIWVAWYEDARKSFPHIRVPDVDTLTRHDVLAFRDWSASRRTWPITCSYGGHYFSPEQATWLDVLRRTIPKREPIHTLALAALISAASRCVASPGHTAQPFQPTRTAKKYLKEAWGKDIRIYTRQALKELATQHARVKGHALVGDANTMAKRLNEGDLVFIDPPYSGVQYSRFYHVLETIANGTSGDVSGVGRYPIASLRPQSKFSLKTYSHQVLQQLFMTIAERNAKAILTYPDYECTNGLSGDIVKESAAEYFRVTVTTVESKFSTLGGNARMAMAGKGREAKQLATELILTLEPKHSRR